jgi:two-component system nitrate/nitrite response regulator NarL
MIRVAILGDIRLTRDALAMLVARDARLEVVAVDDPAALARGSVQPVHVVVLDGAARDRREAMVRELGGIAAPIVVLAAPDRDDEVIALAELGVVGFIEPDGTLADLVGTILSAAGGEASVPPRIAATLLRQVTSLRERRASADVSVLTMRERQVVQLIAEGLSNKEIAGRLCIEVATVKNHVHNILEKLEVSRRRDAVERLRIVPSDATIHSLDAARSTTRSRAT